MPYLRPGSFDSAIWGAVANDYPTTPARFAPHEVVLDLGAHIGAFAALAAARGARVIGYEANRQNLMLARLNTAGLGRVDLRWGAVWRSDVVAGPRWYTPSANAADTGGGSVLFRRDPAAGPVHAAPASPGRLAGAQEEHEVPAVPLDEVLRELGHVRLLKIDVEGAEHPILATSRELARVEQVVGEVHDLSAAGRARLCDEASLDQLSYDGDDLMRILARAGFTVSRVGLAPQSLFHAWRA